jgi:hypothetical protein
MRQPKVRANATEINKTPNEVRYLWVIYPKGDLNRSVPSVCMTYQTLSKVDISRVKEAKVVDLVNNEIYYLNPNSIPLLMEEWRDNYFDPTWAIPVVVKKRR